MKTISLLFLLTVSSLLLEPAFCGFGRTPETALLPSTEKKSSWGRQRRHWSSTGMEGLDHQQVDEVLPVTVSNKKKNNVPKPQPSQEEEHRFEHHPYASGSFALDPHQV